MDRHAIAVAIVFIMAGFVGLTKNIKSDRKEPIEKSILVTVMEIAVIFLGSVCILTGLYIVALTKSYFIGFSFLLSGVMGTTVKCKLPKERFYEEYYDSEKSKKVFRIIGIVFSVFFVILGIVALFQIDK